MLWLPTTNSHGAYPLVTSRPLLRRSPRRSLYGQDAILVVPARFVALCVKASNP